MNVPRSTVARAFGAAPDYDGHAHVQRDVALNLAARIAALNLPAQPRVLEIGCGTGFLTRAAADAGVGGNWLVTDLSGEMVERCRAAFPDSARHAFARLDGEHGAPDGGPFDLICSSLAMQWFDDAPAALSRMAGWLAPGGHVIATTLGPGSFAEWRAAHLAEGLSPGTPNFAAVDAFGAAAVAVESHVESHRDALSFLRALRAIGAQAPAGGHRPLTPGELRRVMARFQQNGCDVTYEVVTCHLARAS